MTEDLKIKYFISHSEKDKKIAEALVDLLIKGLSAHNEDFFQSSRPGNGVSIGDDFILDIKEKIKDAKFIVSLFSRNYLDSGICMAELGAGWILGKTIIPVVIPGVDFSETTPICRNISGISIKSKKGLAKIADKIKNECPFFKIEAWTDNIDKFAEQILDLLKDQAEPEKIEYEKYKNLEDQYNEVCSKNDELVKQIEKKNQENISLRRMKDKKEIEKYDEENSDEITIFKEKCQEIRSSLSAFSKALQYVIFKKYMGEDIVNYRDLCDYGDLKSDIDDGYIEVYNGGASLIETDFEIQELVTLLDNFKRYITNAPSNVFEFIQRKRIVPSLNNAKFWKEFFDASF